LSKYQVILAIAGLMIMAIKVYKLFAVLLYGIIILLISLIIIILSMRLGINLAKRTYQLNNTKWENGITANMNYGVYNG